MRPKPFAARRALPLALAAALVASSVASPAPAAPPMPGGAEFSTTGTWRYGSLDGHAPNRGSIWSPDPAATATWRPNLTAPCPVRVSFFVAPHANNTSAATVQISGAPGRKRSATLDLTSGEPRWETVGTVDFDGRCREQITLSNEGRGALRASALRLEVLDPKDDQMVWQTLVLDEVVPSIGSQVPPAPPDFADLKGHPAAGAAGRLAASGALAGVTPARFAPDVEIRPAEFLSALLAISGSRPGGGAPEAEREAARRGWLGPRTSAGLSFSAAEALSALVAAARSSGKPLDWARLPADPGDVAGTALALGFDLGPGDPATRPNRGLRRGAAAILLDRYARAIAHCGPPSGTWELAFEDHFDGTSVNAETWSVANGQTWGKLLSSRWPENVVVAGGHLRLITKKERRGGTDWTSGMLSTKSFRQKFGYWEARYRYAAAPGLNNAFWTNPGSREPGQGFEIDVNEGHWPNAINMSLHQTGLPSLGKCWRAPVDLSEDFHVYGILWEPDEIVFYWDGQEIDRKPNTQAHLESPVLFSTAVFPWAGPITDRLDGKSMDVDWVRVYRRKPPAP